MYWTPAPAYDPVIPTRKEMSLVTKASAVGGISARRGNKTRRMKKLYSISSRCRNNCFKLFLRVMAIIGKEVLSVNTGKSVKK